MPPITTALSETDSPPKTPKENGDTKAGFLPPFRSSKKKLKWSIDKNKNETSTNESEKNKFNELKSKLTSKSASSFFSPKALMNLANHDNEDDDSDKRNSIENKNSSDLNQEEKDDSRWAEDDSLLTTPQDKTLARQSTGSIINFIEKVVQEILSTEKTYVNNLNEIIEVCDIVIYFCIRSFVPFFLYLIINSFPFAFIINFFVFLFISTFIHSLFFPFNYSFIHIIFYPSLMSSDV